jgi:dTDP-4-amino-4,6-dideoxygalactose transaminase
MSQPNLPVLFNLPHLTGKEGAYLQSVLESRQLAGNGPFTRFCQDWLKERYGFGKVLLTTSCTDALEMCALLSEVGPGDEVILSAFTFVSTANAFALRGAKLVFCDSRADEPNMDVEQVAQLVTSRTKVIVAVHYAGVAVDMDPLLELSRRHNLWIIEDAAQALDSHYKGRPLGSIGHLAAFSFHETKNLTSGEGGAFISNLSAFHDRAEVLWEKGTNRMAYFRGQVDKYTWVDLGSSFLPSELNAAFLRAQLEALDDIQNRRLHIWHRYLEGLKPLEASGKFRLPFVPEYTQPSANLFYILAQSLDERSALTAWLRERQVNAVFHYQRLHSSPFFQALHDGRPLLHTERYADTLLRLPLHYALTDADVDYVIEQVIAFYKR